MGVKIACVSDLHGKLVDTPEADILVIAGDVCPVTSHNIDFQRTWLETNFATWLHNQPAKHIVGIAGNHDFFFEKVGNEALHGLEWHYLQDSSIELEGLKFYGFPWCLKFYDWAFMLPENELYAYERDHIPTDTDVLITHGPAYRWLDQALRGGQNVGSRGLRDLLCANDNIKLHVCGHIHEAAGKIVRQNGQTLVNASAIDFNYEVYEPLRIEVIEV